ncbi:MAG: N-acetylmuramoyl-L-alanine amidase [Chloroflexi bacterium]|uniref:N-acetylmuramoyl-L-alanine amidase n=1 Tax=Candidatus Chlorohelix allophototropha TaxID=3003348 RepID=A0A8T7M7X1_9CHLR|nr:N-acetylmuramoyl-L-alanine amidase [Chloroflexota bacterium]WJW68088.1 N-acetylmuramoyl-L-alanine amidase [Chloroflexota bacterium L227-S17]
MKQACSLKKYGILILLIQLALLLVSCGTNTLAGVPEPTFTPQPSTSATIQATLVVTRPSTVSVPTIAPTVTVEPTPAIVATPEAVSTPGDQEASEPLIQATPLPALSDLPRINGVPKIPVLNPLPRISQPDPTLKQNFGLNNTPLVALQVGHYQIEQLPDEFASLRSQTGGSGGGIREVDLNLEVTKRVAALLTAHSITVEILPATVPAGYTADAFVAIHTDASTGASASGYKIARSRFSAIPVTDDALVGNIFNAYGKLTGLGVSDSITRNMTGYYAFNNRRRVNSISKITPAAIIEMGYLTNSSDRNVLLNRQEAVAQGLADGIIKFLDARPPLAQREKPQDRVTALIVNQDNLPVYSEQGTLLAYVSKGQLFENYEVKGDNYSVFLPVLRLSGYLKKIDVTVTTITR